LQGTGTQPAGAGNSQTRTCQGARSVAGAQSPAHVRVPEASPARNRRRDRAE